MPDLAVADFNVNKVSVFLNTTAPGASTPSFTAKQDFTTGVAPLCVTVGDLNGDGNLDILLVKGRHWPLMSRVLLGDGRGHFPIAYNLGETPYRSYSGHLVDIDGDGDLDMMSVSF